jgi:hypothetical protein
LASFYLNSIVFILFKSVLIFTYQSLGANR